MKAIPPLTLTTESVEETEALGRRLGRLAVAGDVIALSGELGAGKTAFVRGLADGLEVPLHMVASPTFTMVAEYPWAAAGLPHRPLSPGPGRCRPPRPSGSTSTARG